MDRCTAVLQILAAHPGGLKKKDLALKAMGSPAFQDLQPTLWNVTTALTKTLQELVNQGRVRKGDGHAGLWSIVDENP